MPEDVKVFPDLPHNEMPFSMNSLGISYPDENYMISRSCSDVTVIEYVIRGSGTVETSHGVFTASAGDSYLLRAEEPQKYYSNPDDPWEKIWINVQGTLIFPVLDAYGISRSMLLPKLNTYDHIRRIHEIAASETMDVASIMEQCSVVFLELVQYIHRNMPRMDRYSQVPQSIAALKEYLDSHMSEHLTLEKCGEITFLSVSQTIRCFRSTYGLTPYEYLNRRRISTAKLLLLNSNLSIEEIAVQTGFSDRNYFSKYFKKKVGKSPSQFRKQRR